jgi:hypothetical protein
MVKLGRSSGRRRLTAGAPSALTGRLPFASPDPLLPASLLAFSECSSPCSTIIISFAGGITDPNIPARRLLRNRRRLRLGVRFCLIACIVLFVCSSHRQQFCVAWRKHIVLDEPKCVIGKPPAHDGAPMLLHELAEIVGMDDVRCRAGSDKGA